MQQQRLTGPGAGAEKYDLLTAMAVKGLAEGATAQTSLMRLMALITARYNWAADEVSVGQRDMAALWSVDERTAKRETRRLIENGWLEIKRPGVRGRVAAYRLRYEEIYRQTAATWTNVGTDYNARMAARQQPDTRDEKPVSSVVKVDFPLRAPVAAQPETPWARVLTRLATDHPGLYGSWFSQLSAGLPDSEGLLLIYAPSRFVAGYVSGHLRLPLERAVSLVYGTGLRCQIVAPST